MDDNFVPFFAENHNKYKENLVSTMKECIPGFKDESVCYKRYEMLLYDEEFQIFEAKTNNQIPNCSYHHALPKLYNAIQNILPKEGLNADQPGLITFTFLVDHDCIRVYAIFADGAKQLYGTRIFENDLRTIIPKLFSNSNLSKTTELKLDRLEFIADPVYNKYYKYLGAEKKNPPPNMQMVELKACDAQDHVLNEDCDDIKVPEDDMKYEQEEVDDDYDADAEYDPYNPYDDDELFDGLLDQEKLYEDERLYYEEETINRLLYQLDKMGHEIRRMLTDIEYDNCYKMNDDEINKFNDKETESGLQLPSDW